MVTTPDRRRGSAIHSPDALLPALSRLAVALVVLFATLGWGQAVAVPATAADLEKEPLTLVCWIGLRDGADGSDGITSNVEVGEAGKPRTLLASTHHQEQRWQLCMADISTFRDRQVTSACWQIPARPPSPTGGPGGTSPSSRVGRRRTARTRSWTLPSNS
jgi:hypothetical protein